MTKPTNSTRLRRIAAHKSSTQPVPATLYDDDMAGLNVLDRAIVNDNTPIDLSINSGAALTVSGKTWQVLGGVGQWA